MFLLIPNMMILHRHPPHQFVSHFINLLFAVCVNRTYDSQPHVASHYESIDKQANHKNADDKTHQQQPAANSKADGKTHQQEPAANAQAFQISNSQAHQSSSNSQAHRSSCTCDSPDTNLCSVLPILWQYV